MEEANVNVRDGSGKSPLMWASICGHTQVVGLLLECKDIQVDLVDNDGFQAIHWSAQEGFPEITQLLLTQGASVNVQIEPRFTLSGCTPLYLASQCLRDEVDKTPGSPTRDFTMCVQVLLDKGANVNLAGREEWTPLHSACRCGNNTNIVKLLISHGADVNIQTNDGSTPLILSCQEGFVTVVEILLQHHAKSHIKNNHGSTALYWACRKGFDKCASLLLDVGASLSSTHPCLWLLISATSPVWSCYCVEGLRFNGRGTNPHYVWLRPKVTLLW